MREDMMVHFRMLGPLARYTGYAVGFRGMCRTLIEHHPDLDFQLRATKSYIPEGTEPELLDLIANNGDYDRLGVSVGFPDIANDICTRYLVLYTMYEANDIPDDWKPVVASAREVWVPSQFCAEVFRKYNPRIRIVPWGIDEAVFRKGKRKRRAGEYVFGAVGRQGPRKGTDVMVRAFEMAFGGRDDVKLVIKTRDTASLPEIRNENVEVIDTDWDEAQLAQFYRDIDCLVEPSRGEGFGQPPMQAAFCGTPSLVTSWSGPVDYLDDNGIWGIRIKGLVPATKGMKAKNCYWAEPDEKHLAELMQWAVETRPQVRGDYSRWTLKSQANVFAQYIREAWARATR